MRGLLVALVLLTGCVPTPSPKSEIHIRIPTPIGTVVIDRNCDGECCP